MSTRAALLLGATGLVGRHLLDRLLADDTYARVTTLGRRRLERSHPRLGHHVVDFDRLGEHAALFAVDDVFCCLGTTMKQAGTREAFRRVDHDYPLRAAELAAENGARQYLLVSSTGADASSLFFYNRVKGEVEAAIQRLDFEGVYLLRPSLLTGDRAEQRAGEKMAERVLDTLSFALRGPLGFLRPTAAEDVAEALLRLARQQPGGVQVYEPDDIRRIAGAA